jgi:hypothetical protein
VRRWPRGGNQAVVARRWPSGGQATLAGRRWPSGGWVAVLGWPSFGAGRAMVVGHRARRLVEEEARLGEEAAPVAR